MVGLQAAQTLLVLTENDTWAPQGQAAYDKGGKKIIESCQIRWKLACFAGSTYKFHSRQSSQASHGSSRASHQVR